MPAKKQHHTGNAKDCGGEGREGKKFVWEIELQPAA